MNREEILKMASGNDPELDEYHEQVDIEGADRGFTATLVICIIIAALKIFVFKTDPYDVFLIEFIGATNWFYYKWKKLHYKRHKYLTIIYFILSVLCLLFFLIWEVFLPQN